MRREGEGARPQYDVSQRKKALKGDQLLLFKMDLDFLSESESTEVFYGKQLLPSGQWISEDIEVKEHTYPDR